MSPKEIFSQLSLWTVNLYLKSYIFCYCFNLYLHVWIRMQEAREYGSNTDPDPQHRQQVDLKMATWQICFKRTI